MTNPRVNSLFSKNNWINRRGKKGIEIRSKTIEHIINSTILDYDGINVERDISREEFRGAIQRYLLGFYYDSIFSSCTSIELSLLNILNEQLSDDEKNEIHERINNPNRRYWFTFGTIYGNCKRYLSDNEKDLIEQILSIRNTQFHAYNYLSSMLTLYKRLLSEKQIMINKMEDNKNKPIYKLLFLLIKTYVGRDLIEAINTFQTMPDYDWCAKEDQSIVIQNDVETYFNEIVDSFNLAFSYFEKLQLRKLFSQCIALNELLIGDYYFKEKSKKTLELAYEILLSLDFIHANESPDVPR